MFTSYNTLIFNLFKAAAERVYAKNNISPNTVSQLKDLNSGS